MVRLRSLRRPWKLILTLSDRTLRVRIYPAARAVLESVARYAALCVARGPPGCCRGRPGTQYERVRVNASDSSRQRPRLRVFRDGDRAERRGKLRESSDDVIYVDALDESG